MYNTQQSASYPLVRIDGVEPIDVDDLVAIEEPLEIWLEYFDGNKWSEFSLLVTMRTPGDDQALVTGLLFSEGVINRADDIVKIGVPQSTKNFDTKTNVVKVKIHKRQRLERFKLQRHFAISSSCGVCGKGSINAIVMAHNPRIDPLSPSVKKTLITTLPERLREVQKEFSKTGGVHASALVNQEGELLAFAEDVGRHNALDKLIGAAINDDGLDPTSQLVVCSGRLSYDIVQKVAIARIGMVVGVGAPTSLAVDMALELGITLVGFVKKNGYNIYTYAERIVS